ncbi:MAG: PqqD family protein [Planctomycetia bacterium]
MSAAFVANDRIAAEEFAGEVVLIDIEKGVYFSLQGAAVDLWRAFSAPRSPAAVLDMFAAHGADRQALEAALGDLCRHDLVCETAVPALPDIACSAPAGGFAAPVVAAFSDLAELIAIDPVHEVDATAGWPLRPANFPDVS